MPTLKRLGNNMVEVQNKHADFFFSYDTCVGINHYHNGCIYIDKCPVYGQESGISRTTARHIKKWLDGRQATHIDHDTFEGIASIIS
jgi:hypothetical protein